MEHHQSQNDGTHHQQRRQLHEPSNGAEDDVPTILPVRLSGHNNLLQPQSYVSGHYNPCIIGEAQHMGGASHQVSAGQHSSSGSPYTLTYPPSFNAAVSYGPNGSTADYNGGQYLSGEPGAQQHRYGRGGTEAFYLQPAGALLPGGANPAYSCFSPQALPYSQCVNPSSTTLLSVAAKLPSIAGVDSSQALFSRAALRQCSALPQPPLARVCSLFETFCTVPGRMSLLSSTTKYKVTVGEIQRRISPPECLNASLLGGILRKAKSKDGGKALRESLKRIGLNLPPGRRKSTHITAWTALVEEEALHMARDFQALCEREFPAREVALYLARGAHSPEEAQRRRTMLYYARMCIRELSELLNADRSPVCGQRPELLLDPGIQKPLTHFSMLSHGFGPSAMASMLDSLAAYVHESLRMLDKSFPTASSNIGGTSALSHPGIYQ